MYHYRRGLVSCLYRLGYADLSTYRAVDECESTDYWRSQRYQLFTLRL